MLWAYAYALAQSEQAPTAPLPIDTTQLGVAGVVVAILMVGVVVLWRLHVKVVNDRITEKDARIAALEAELKDRNAEDRRRLAEALQEMETARRRTG